MYIYIYVSIYIYIFTCNIFLSLTPITVLFPSHTGREGSYQLRWNRQAWLDDEVRTMERRPSIGELLVFVMKLKKKFADKVRPNNPLPSPCSKSDLRHFA